MLVTLQDGKPAAKIIDFGLARATDHRLTEKTLFTEQGVILGTPEYMSPEQAGLNALDIDMRSDIYTLGVLLYELLAVPPGHHGWTTDHHSHRVDWSGRGRRAQPTHRRRGNGSVAQCTVMPRLISVAA